MIPGNITPHPDAPDAYITMKAPPGMDNCVDLNYRIVNAAGRTSIMAEFELTEAERKDLTAGQPVRFMMCLLQDQEGRPIVPPISIWVREDGEV